jgi:hypothetical protein
MSKPAFDPAVPSGDTTWPEPQLGDAELFGPPFPVHALPALLSGFVAESSQALQVAPDFLGMLAITVAAASHQRVLTVSGLQHAEGASSLWTLLAADSGERKSPALRLVQEPIDEAERSLRKEYAPQVEQGRRERAARDKELTRLTGQREEALRDGNDAGAAQLEKDIAEAQRTMPPQMALPSLMVDDATPEALARKLAQQCGRVIQICDESNKLIGHATGSMRGTEANLDALVTAYDGGTVRVDRVGKSKGAQTEMILAPNAALSIAGMGQRQTMTRLANDPTLRDSGFVGRFSYVVPERSGARFVEVERDDDGSIRRRAGAEELRPVVEYRAVLARMWERGFKLNLAGDSQVITLSDEALAAWVDYTNEIERRRQPGGDLHGFAGWSSKHAGRALRIAAALHATDWYARTTLMPDGSLEAPRTKEGAGPWDELVSGKTMRGAIEIARYLEQHARIALCQPDAEALQQLAATADWLRLRLATGRARVTLRDLTSRGPRALRRDQDRAFAVLRLLEERGVVRAEAARRSDSFAWEINPRLAA